MTEEEKTQYVPVSVDEYKTSRQTPWDLILLKGGP
jgi:hypothetical protein